MTASTIDAVAARIHPRSALRLGLRTCSILSVAAYLPHQVVTNAEIGRALGDQGEWILRRTGVSERRRAAENEFTSDLAVHAAANALTQAGLCASDLDLILVATNTPDMMFPATACLVQAKLGAHRCPAFDLKAGGAGFLYALEIGRQFVVSRTSDTVMVIGAEKLSTVLDGKDRATCAIFGDGAGAAVLQHRPGAAGILCTPLGTDGAKAELLHILGGGCRLPTSRESVTGGQHFLRMLGQRTFKQAVLAMCAAAGEALLHSQITLRQIACIIPHQANRRLVEAFAKRVGAAAGQVFMNLENVGNTSTASIPIALAEAVEIGRVKRGDRVLLVGFGSGLTWGATILEW
jgi:3-oxoacyl-[acyl-carrier-protein] synthase-3